MHISSSSAKILEETNFHTRVIPRSGSKAKDGERREKKRDQKLVITMASYALHCHLGGAHKAAWANTDNITCKILSGSVSCHKNITDSQHFLLKLPNQLKILAQAALKNKMHNCTLDRKC